MNKQDLEKLLCHIRALSAEKRPVLVAIEGGSASGKSTLAAQIAQRLDCNVFHMDDFFLQPHQRTPERFSQPGGNVDRERFLQEVLTPLQAGKAFSYRVFDCGKMDFGECVQVSPKGVNIVEGAYCMHPELAPCYDLSVFLRIEPEEQQARILQRNGARMLERFVQEWIPLEQRYFDATQAAARCTFCFQGE